MTVVTAVDVAVEVALGVARPSSREKAGYGLPKLRAVRECTS
jgi:hypothetical protein